MFGIERLLWTNRELEGGGKAMKKYRIVVAVIMSIFLLLSIGCDSAQKAQTPASSSSTQQTDDKKAVQQPEKKTVAQEENIQVYFPNADGTKLIAVSKKIKTGNDKYKAAMQALLEGTTDKKLTVVMPKNTKLQSVKVDKNIAYVDFSKEFIKNFTGGSTGEIMLVGSIVDTLTEYPEIKAVQILVDGKEIDSLSGHMDLSTPLQRMKDLLKN
jgi:germination protein M